MRPYWAIITVARPTRADARNKAATVEMHLFVLFGGNAVLALGSVSQTKAYFSDVIAPTKDWAVVSTQIVRGW